MWKEERRRGFLLAESFTTDEWRKFCCLHRYSCCCLKNCGDLFWSTPRLFCQWLRSFQRGKYRLLHLKSHNMSWADGSWLDLSLLGRKVQKTCGSLNMMKLACPGRFMNVFTFTLIKNKVVLCIFRGQSAGIAWDINTYYMLESLLKW